MWKWGISVREPSSTKENTLHHQSLCPPHPKVHKGLKPFSIRAPKTPGMGTARVGDALCAVPHTSHPCASPFTGSERGCDPSTRLPGGILPPCYLTVHKELLVNQEFYPTLHIQEQIGNRSVHNRRERLGI